MSTSEMSQFASIAFSEAQISSPEQFAHLGQRRASRLSSISLFAKSFNRRRSTTDGSSSSSHVDSLANINDNHSFQKSLSPTAIPSPQKSTSRPRPGLPRSATISNLPRPTSGQRGNLERWEGPLQSDVTSVTLKPSRIPTPSPVKRRISFNPGLVTSSASLVSLCSPPATSARSQDQTNQRNYSLGPTGRSIKKAGKDGLSIAFETASHNVEDSVFTPRNGEEGKLRKTPLRAAPSARMMPSSEIRRRPIQVRARTAISDSKSKQSLASPGSSEWTGPKEIEAASAPGKSRQSHDIVHHQLLKTISPLDKPKTPHRTSIYITGKAAESMSPRRPRSVSKQLTSAIKSSIHSLSSFRPTSASRQRNDSIQDLDPSIYKGQPFAYWSGRFTGLSDCLLNSSCNIPGPKDENSRFKMLAWEELKAGRIFESLENLCKTSAAKESLSRFKRFYASKHKMPQLLNVQHVPGRLGEKSRSRDSGESESSYASGDFAVTLKSLRSKTALDATFTPESIFSEVSGHSVEKARKSHLMDRLVRKGKWGSS